VTTLDELPTLGVGFVYWPSLERLLHLDTYPIDVLEIEPQPFWFTPSSSTSPFQLDQRAFEHIRQLPQTKLVHGVGFPIGGTVPPDDRQLAGFVESIALLEAPWASEHLSFNRVHRGASSIDVGFLMPPLQNSHGIAAATANIVALKARLPVPFAFETGVSYLKPLPGELSDGAFFAAVAREADCAILLDLHNVWANERNGRQSVADLIEELPLERIIELHLAGGQEHDGYWVDAHSDLVPTEVMDLARYVIPRLPNLRAIIYEVMPEYVEAHGISDGELAEQFCALRQLWQLRRTYSGTRQEERAAVEVRSKPLSRVSPLAWEDALTAAVSGEPLADATLSELLTDPGTSVLRDLIGAVRSGKVADTLNLTTRLLLLTLGDQGLGKIFDEFWSSVPSEQMASVEALNFVGYLMSLDLEAEVPHLHSVAEFELAVHRAIITGRPQHVTFTVDPESLLHALREGKLPPTVQAGNFDVTVSPP
jgi:uncharacterized protein (UPF0276 family)